MPCSASWGRHHLQTCYHSNSELPQHVVFPFYSLSACHSPLCPVPAACYFARCPSRDARPGTLCVVAACAHALHLMGSVWVYYLPIWHWLHTSSDRDGNPTFPKLMRPNSNFATLTRTPELPVPKNQESHSDKCKYARQPYLRLSVRPWAAEHRDGLRRLGSATARASTPWARMAA